MLSFAAGERGRRMCRGRRGALPASGSCALHSNGRERVYFFLSHGPVIDVQSKSVGREKLGRGSGEVPLLQGSKINSAMLFWQLILRRPIE
jgi:hypothetical protein